MKTTVFLNQFVYSPEYDSFLGYGQGYKPDPDVYRTVHFVWETFLAENQIGFQEDKSKLHYVCDIPRFLVIGPLPLTVPEFIYMVFVTSLLYYTDPDVELAYQWTELHCAQFPELAEFRAILDQFCS